MAPGRKRARRKQNRASTGRASEARTPRAVGPAPGGYSPGQQASAQGSRAGRGPVGWFSSLSQGMKWVVGAVITAGAVASAVGSILALRPAPTAELGAAITKIWVDRNVTLAEYRARSKTAAFVEGRAGTSYLAAATGTSTTPRQLPTTPSGATRSGPTPSGPTPSGPTPSGPTPSGPTPSGPTPNGPTPTGPTSGGVGLSTLDPEARARLGAGVHEAVAGASGGLPIVIGPACATDPTSRDCGLGSTALYLKVLDDEGHAAAGVSAGTIANRLGKLLAEARMAQTAGQRVPMGVTVNYDITLTGFRGRKVVVRWSLFSLSAQRPVPRDWLNDEPVRWLQGEATKDSASDSFWIPLPKLHGPFYVRVGVFNDHDVRLDFANSAPFQ